MSQQEQHGGERSRSVFDYGQMNIRQKEVFIGGFGQSGTSSLSQFLSAHPLILACPYESSFIIAPNGLIDVVRVVSDEYCASRIDPILHEFNDLMHHQLCSPASFPYGNFDLASYFGRGRYHAAIDRFQERIGVRKYDGEGITIDSFLRIGSWRPAFRFGRFRLPAWCTQQRRYLYYAVRQERKCALQAARALLDDLFAAKARENGRLVWCDQTTPNQQVADFLLELCPSGLYVNMIHDPLDVAIAQHIQHWSPNDFEMICMSVRSLCDQWFAVREKLAPESYIEVRFEDLADAPERELSRICAAIGVSFAEEMLEHRLDPAQLAQKHTRRKLADLAVYRRILGDTAERLGYAVP